MTAAFLLQISQMVVGIAVTVSSVLYIGNGHTCYVSLVNSAIGLAMYSSYDGGHFYLVSR
jgi:hypothetical protein